MKLLALELLGNFNKCLKEYTKIIEDQKLRSKENQIFLAASYLKRGLLNLDVKKKVGLAIIDFQESLKISRDPQVLYAMGRAFEEKKDFSKAKENYEECLQLEKDFSLANEALERISRIN